MKPAAFTLLLCCAVLARSGSLLQYAEGRAKARTNPLAGDADAPRAGAKLFARECAGCHPAHAPPLTSPLVRQASPGALFWVLRNGSPGRRMPSFAHLPEAQRCQIITFLQRGMPAPVQGQ